MENYLMQLIVPFILTSLIVIIITIFAERYGTKIGGIIGTLPHTTMVAFLFIGLNKGADFAALSISIVPAAIGINIIFLLAFTLFVYRSILLAIISSLMIWGLLSTILYISELNNIYISITIFCILSILTLVFLEHYKKISSTGRVMVHYTTLKILIRGVLAGIIIAGAVLLSNIGATLSGIFSVFPVISLSTMIISVTEHGPRFAGGLAKAMIFGSPSVISYAIAIYFLYPAYGIIIGTIIAYVLSMCIALFLFRNRDKIR
jgi:uncharacterized membrane protein (GlpM family)